MNEIYKMKLHEMLVIDSKENIQIIRVPGGWIYRLHYYSTGNDSFNSVFVPYHSPGEFK